MISQIFQNFAADCAVRYFFGIPSWDKYLIAAGRIKEGASTGACEMVGAFEWKTEPGTTSDLTFVLLGILDILLRLAGLVAVVFIIWGGIQYITSDGAPDATKDAQQTIINALVGLVISLLATATVSFIGTAVAK